jgi:dimeric dUTPase (all-alpha-NTP-PPase superfamily)
VIPCGELIRLEDKIDYGELREALTDIHYAVQYIHLILRFKYYKRPGFQVRFLEIFNDISKFISSPSEEIFASFPELKLRLGCPEADFNRIYDLIDLFSSLRAV